MDGASPDKRPVRYDAPESSSGRSAPYFRAPGFCPSRVHAGNASLCHPDLAILYTGAALRDPTFAFVYRTQAQLYAVAFVCAVAFIYPARSPAVILRGTLLHTGAFGTLEIAGYGIALGPFGTIILIPQLV